MKHDTTNAMELKELAVIENNRQIRWVRYSPCENFLCAATYQGQILRWDVSAAEPQPLEPLSGHSAWVEQIAFTGDALLSADSWGKLCAWHYGDKSFAQPHAEPRWQQPTAHDGWIRSLALSADGKRVATGGRDRTARVWNTSDGALVAEFTEHENELFAVALDTSGERLVTGDCMGIIQQWNVAEKALMRDKRLQQMHYYDRDQDVAGLYHLGWHPTRPVLLCGGSHPTKIQNVFGVPLLLELAADSWEIQAEHKLGVDKDGYLFDFAWHQDGGLIFVTSGAPGAGRLVIQQLDQEQPQYENSTLFNPHGLAYAPGRRQVAVASTNKRSQGNGAVRDADGNYLGNTSPLHLFEIVS